MPLSLLWSRLLQRWLLAACTTWWLVGPVAAEVVVRDDRGAQHRFAKAPRRIVTLLPSLTESVCALGACDRLVGTDRYSNFPDQVKALPKLGGLDDAQIEGIVALKPDVVLASKSARVTERLESLGVTVLLLDSQTHADVKRSLVMIGTLLGVPHGGERVWAAIERDTALAAARVPPARRGQRVYFEVASAPYGAGAASFVGETLSRLGMGNVVPADMGPFPKLNPEVVVRSQPDIVMAAQRELSTMSARPGWQSLHALTSGRSCGFESARFEMLTRPGPRMGEAALAIADCLAALPPGLPVGQATGAAK